MLPKLDMHVITHDANTLVTTARVARDNFKARYTKFRQEADAYARLPENPLAQLHRQKEAELKAEVLAVVDDHPQKIAALRASLTAAKRQLDLRTLLHEGGRFKPVKEDSDLRELLNFALQDRYAARFRALSVEEQRDEIESLTARIDFNDPDPAIAAKLATIDLAQPQGLARSALIAAFTTLETKWKNRTELVSQIEQAEQDLSAAEGYAAAIERPELPLPTAAAMNEAAEHGHLKVA